MKKEEADSLSYPQWKDAFINRAIEIMVSAGITLKQADDVAIGLSMRLFELQHFIPPKTLAEAVRLSKASPPAVQAKTEDGSQPVVSSTSTPLQANSVSCPSGQAGLP